MPSSDKPKPTESCLQAPRRNHFFYGKRMDVQHFQMEQEHGQLKRQLINRLGLGKGVLCGLKVSLDGTRLCVDPGVALDGLGREVVVPVRQCIDALTHEGGCCEPDCCAEADPPALRRPGTDLAPGIGLLGDVAKPFKQEEPTPSRLALYTLWLCYRECRTDHQPVLVSDCNSREACAPGTVVESFCLKVSPGLAPLQHDPDWCAHLWPGKDRAQPSEEEIVRLKKALESQAPAAGQVGGLPGIDELLAAVGSRRRVLCELFDDDCCADRGEACVPLAAFMVVQGRVLALDNGLVRPRVYSNAALLNLILCLAERIDACCEGHTPPPPPPPDKLMQVVSVDFIDPDGKTVLGVGSPLVTTQVPIAARMQSILIRFSQPMLQGAQGPTTHDSFNDANFKRHTVQVTPAQGMLNNLAYVPGNLRVLDDHTLQFDQIPEPPYSRGPKEGWQKGAYRLFVAGLDDPVAARRALLDKAGHALDGESHAPAGGVISGNGQAGGDFTLVFNVG